jgi:hypothetical protein
MLLRIGVAAAVLSFAGEAWAQAEQLMGRYRRWRAELDGDFRSSDNGLAGSEVDVHGNADLSEEQDLNELAAKLVLPMVGQVNLQYFFGAFEGDSTLSTDVTFGTAAFTAGTPVEAETEWKIWSILWEYGPGGGPAQGNPMTGFALQAGFKYVDIHLELASAALSEDATVKGWLPAFGVHYRQAVMRWAAVEIEVNSLFTDLFSYGGLDGTYLDAAVQVQVVYSGFYAGIGHRWFRIDVTDDKTDADETAADLKLDGFFIEVGIKY